MKDHILAIKEEISKNNPIFVLTGSKRFIEEVDYAKKDYQLITIDFENPQNTPQWDVLSDYSKLRNLFDSKTVKKIFPRNYQSILEMPGFQVFSLNEICGICDSPKKEISELTEFFGPQFETLVEFFKGWDKRITDMTSRREINVFELTHKKTIVAFLFPQTYMNAVNDINKENTKVNKTIYNVFLLMMQLVGIEFGRSTYLSDDKRVFKTSFIVSDDRLIFEATSASRYFSKACINGIEGEKYYA